MKMCGGVASPFLTSATDGSEWSAYVLRFAPGERAGTHLIGAYVDPQSRSGRNVELKLGKVFHGFPLTKCGMGLLFTRVLT
jgi:hypothetical protein